VKNTNFIKCFNAISYKKIKKNVTLERFLRYIYVLFASYPDSVYDFHSVVGVYSVSTGWYEHAGCGFFIGSII
jgi:hypothetical protein